MEQVLCPCQLSRNWSLAIRSPAIGGRDLVRLSGSTTLGRNYPTSLTDQTAIESIHLAQEMDCARDGGNRRALRRTPRRAHVHSPRSIPPWLPSTRNGPPVALALNLSRTEVAGQLG